MPRVLSFLCTAAAAAAANDDDFFIYVFMFQRVWPASLADTLFRGEQSTTFKTEHIKMRVSGAFAVMHLLAARLSFASAGSSSSEACPCMYMCMCARIAF